MKNRILKTLLIFLSISSVLVSCASVDAMIKEGNESAQTTTQTESQEVDTEKQKKDSNPDYSVVFPDKKVNEITISITEENWQMMLADMTEKYGEFGKGEERRGDFRAQGGAVPDMPIPGEEGQAPVMPLPDGQAPANRPNPPADGAIVPDMGADARRQQGGDGMGGRMVMDSKDNPIWVEATIAFNDEVWEHVGIRFKGNSSLRSSWSSGSYKLPFKLDFDQFEDTYPETKNQRLYGFKQLSFSSNFSDASYLREYVAADIFRAAGVPLAETAFYAVYLDYGAGKTYLGLYTAVEVVDDTLIKTQFEDDSGNVYKPSGSSATFAAGGYNETAFDKETNEDEADFSDVQALYTIINDTALRQRNPSAWRAALEEVFDMEVFIRWLAVNTIIQNWDTYGNMAHNYYLYHDPSTDKLVWIPWDNNMALSSRQGMEKVLSLGLDEVNERWPLIRYVMDDEVYYQMYVRDVEYVATEVFNPETMIPIYEELHALVAEYVQKEQNSAVLLTRTENFGSSLQALVQHVRTRYQAVMEFLASI